MSVRQPMKKIVMPEMPGAGWPPKGMRPCFLLGVYALVSSQSRARAGKQPWEGR